MKYEDLFTTHRRWEVDFHQSNPQWPKSADKRVQRFMHENELYYTVNLEDGQDLRIKELISRLRNTNPDIKVMQGTAFREFQGRVIQRVKYLTGRFLQDNFIELHSDGPRITDRFRYAWNSHKDQIQSSRPGKPPRVIESQTNDTLEPSQDHHFPKTEPDVLGVEPPKKRRRGPASENTWRKTTIPPPQDINIFPNLVRETESSGSEAPSISENTAPLVRDVNAKDDDQKTVIDRFAVGTSS